MKNKALGLCLLFSTQTLAQEEYHLDYTLSIEGEKIGTLKATLEKNKAEQFQFTNEIKITYPTLFGKDYYHYKERIITQNNIIESLFITEKQNDQLKTIKAKNIQGNLVYETGEKVSLKSIDYYTFNYQPNIFSIQAKNKNFHTTTLDLQSAEVYEEEHHVFKTSEENLKIKSLNPTYGTQTTILNKNNTVIYTQNIFFESHLIKKGQE